MENTDLVLVDGALTEFSRVDAGLAQLETNFKGVLFECDTELGMLHAKAARKAVRDPRLEVEKIRIGAKRPLLAVGKKLDAEAERITNRLIALERPIDQQIKEEEQRVERERLAKLEAERVRVAQLNARIEEIRGLVSKAVNLPSDTVQSMIDNLSRLPVDQSFQELQQQADDAKTATLSRLREIYSAAVEREAERERIAAERRELERRRAEDAERERVALENARQIRAEREENERIARQNREALDRQAEEQRQESARQAGILAAERAKFEAEKQAAAAPVAPDPALNRGTPIQGRDDLRMVAAPAKPRYTAKPMPEAGEIIAVIAVHFAVTPDTAKMWLNELFNLGEPA